MSKIKQAHREEIKKYGECRITNCEKCLHNRQKEEASKRAKELKARQKAEKALSAKGKSNKPFVKRRN